jgi:DMSO/TMAO reductase YedYZ molybdopterin-dependent catalytic subunit
MNDQLTIVTSQTLALSQTDLAARADVIEIAKLGSKRTGRAVRLGDLLGDVEIGESTELVLSSSADGFSATLPLGAAVEVGLVWFAGTDGPLTKQQGGPFRFLIPNAAACKTAVLDTCANVKFVDRIEVRQKESNA